jgi:hypothetical protein
MRQLIVKIPVLKNRSGEMSVVSYDIGLSVTIFDHVEGGPVVKTLPINLCYLSEFDIH